MFFNSAREAQVSRIYGVTDGVGVTLLHQDHPFPLLVEEEERRHGALIANTTHGALYRALSSLGPWRPALLEPTTPERLDDIPPIRVFNACRYHADALVSGYLDVHEACAKYPAYVLQSRYMRGRSAAALRQRFEDDAAAYPLLQDIAARFGDPCVPSSRQDRTLLAYTLGKFVLNVGALSRLLALPTYRDLYAAIREDTLVESAETRWGFALAALDRDGWDASGKTLYDDLTARARADGFACEAALDNVTLGPRATLLGLRLAVVARAYSCHLSWRHFGLAGGPGPIEIDPRNLDPEGRVRVPNEPHTVGAVLDADPSLSVYYDVPSRSGEWPEITLSGLKPQRTHDQAVYLAPAETPGRVDAYLFGGDLVGVVRNATWPQLRGRLGRTARDRTVITLLRPAMAVANLHQDPAIPLAARLSPHGQVVYWNLAPRPWSLIGPPLYAYVPRPIVRDDRQDFQGACGAIVLGHGFAAVGATPWYALEIMASRALGAGAPKMVLIGETATHLGQMLQDGGGAPLSAEVTAAAWVHEQIYGEDLMPGDLPIYDPNQLHQRLAGAAVEPIA